MSSFEEIVSLRGRIRDELATNPQQGDAEFLPDNMVEVFANRGEVTTALQAAGLGTNQGLVEFVLARAQRIFLILVMITTKSEEKLSHLEGFQNNRIDDDWLPLKFKRSNQTFHAAPWNNLTQQVDLALQDHNDIDLFDKWQWVFTSPVFKDKFHFSFYPRTTLPYLSENQPVGEGFFGEVSEVEVHPAHVHVPKLGLSSQNTPIPIALKRIKDDIARKYWDLVIKEQDNLEKLQTHGYKSHHLINPIASYEHNRDRYLIFPWADGGTLLSYQKSFADRPAQVSDLRWIIGQFIGLFAALEELHDTNCRHGDLKPDNILWFKNDRKEGCLQIADLGLATFHKLITDMRREKNMQTMTPSGNLRYSPPETGEEGDSKDARSRVYDTWSLGCVLLEMLVWLVYGPTGVDRFGKLTPKSFWIQGHGGQEPQVHDVVNRCTERLEADLRECGALKDILGLVRNGLLIISVQERKTATDAHRRMVEILENCESNPSYLVSIQARVHFPIEQLEGILQQGHSATEKYKQESPTTNFSMVSNHQEYPIFRSCNLDDTWESFPDNKFASDLFQSLDWDRVRPRPSQLRSQLCSRCSGMKATPLFDEECDTSTLQKTCGLCGLLLDGLEQAGIVAGKVVKLRQTATVIGIEDGPNLVSLYSEPGSDTPSGCQIGLPQLLDQASQDQFSILKAWIQVCDSTHGNCHRKYQLDGFSMPTRLIEVGETVRLVLSTSIEPPSRYVALSHCWGRLSESQKFCAYQSNIEQLKVSINVDRMPQTFKDAITVTRGLGIKYLWIDSLCIIQDDNDDWANEAGKMEQVFSAAYCTIGASSAESSLVGFLADRPSRPCVQIQTEDMGSLYACPAIDDFHRDVELGVLNTRGWVLQERALSRRTIHYSSSQVYWECGDGVHCETLGRLKNSKAAFLGDANFPKSALDYYKDGRQVLIQDLYERYSRLSFSRPSDRPVAILGLQKRLARALNTPAAYGFFEAYFARGLLWQRGQEQDLTPVTQPTGEQLPSWSWLSIEGAITHLDLEFQKIVWATDDYKNPFENHKSPPSTRSFGSNDGNVSPVLRGLARCMNMSQNDLMNHVNFDRKHEHGVDELRCVIIGRDKAPESEMDNRMVHVLVIVRSNSIQGEEVYRRIGVASLSSALVASQGSPVDIW